MSYSCEASDAYAVYRETVRKARKAHKCSACRIAIRPGDYYCAVSWVADRYAGGVKRCGSCQLTHLHLRELCSAASDPCDYEQKWPDEWLACGLNYADEWGSDPPDHIADLPLLGPDERGSLLRAATR